MILEGSCDGQQMSRASSRSSTPLATGGSAGKLIRMPISKKRNKHIQEALVEAAKLALRCNHELALVYDREQQRGNKNRAKMVAYMLAVEHRNRTLWPPSNLAGYSRMNRCIGMCPSVRSLLRLDSSPGILVEGQFCTLIVPLKFCLRVIAAAFFPLCFARKLHRFDKS
jgi:hypothetical protein